MSKVSNEIAVQERNEFGNNASRRARKAGMIPAVVYSKGKPSKALTVDADAWKVLAGHGVHMVTLVEGESRTLALVKEVQYNYLKNYVLHIDFQAVNANEEISAQVPIHAIGEAIGAAHGGILEQELHELEVLCHPTELPELIKVDVSKLDMGDMLHVSDIVLPSGVKTDVDPETTVFHVVHPKQEEEAPAEELTEPEAINEKKAEADAEAKK